MKDLTDQGGILLATNKVSIRIINAMLNLP